MNNENNEGLGKLFDKEAKGFVRTTRVINKANFISICQSPELREMVVGTCKWTVDNEGCYDTQCGKYFVYEETLEKCSAQYCQNCGGKIIELK